MNKESFHDLFASIDAQNTPKFLSFLAPNVRFQFGNWPAVVGLEATGASVDQFFGSIQALSHKLLNVWVTDEHAVARGEVTYTRKDSSQVTLPFTNVYLIEGGKINDYQIHMDINPLYAQA